MGRGSDFDRYVVPCSPKSGNVGVGGVQSTPQVSLSLTVVQTPLKLQDRGGV